MKLLENYALINYGKLIYHYRIKRNFTQEELSRGLCSISYLSKLENNKIDSSNDEVVGLLCERLSIDINDYHTGVKETKSLLEVWYESIQSKDNVSAENHYKQLRNYFTNESLQIDLKYWFEIISLRYFILINDSDYSRMKLIEISKIQKNFNIKQQIYFTYFTGIIKCKNKEFVSGIEFLIEADKNLIEHNLSDDEIDYHLALTYSHLSNVTLAIYHSKKALKIFNDNSIYQRSIDCQLLLGINFARIGKIEEAKKYYFNIIKMASQLNFTATLGKVFNNLGYLFQKTNDVQQAIEYYEKSLEYKQAQTPQYGISVYGLVKSLIQKGDSEKVLFWINKGIKSLSSCDETTKIRLNKLKLEFLEDKGLLTFLENTAIPHFKQKGDLLNLCETYEELADYYSSIFQYKKSSQYYYLSNQYHKKMANL